MNIKSEWDVEVKHEEIVIHPTAKKTFDGFLVEARIIGTVEIEGIEYEFNKVIQVKAEAARHTNARQPRK